MVATRGWEVEETGDAGQKVQASGCKMNELWGSNVQRDDYGQ